MHFLSCQKPESRGELSKRGPAFHRASGPRKKFFESVWLFAGGFCDPKRAHVPDLSFSARISFDMSAFSDSCALISCLYLAISPRISSITWLLAHSVSRCASALHKSRSLPIWYELFLRRSCNERIAPSVPKLVISHLSYDRMRPCIVVFRCGLSVRSASSIMSLHFLTRRPYLPTNITCHGGIKKVPAALACPGMVARCSGNQSRILPLPLRQIDCRFRSARLVIIYPRFHRRLLFDGVCRVPSFWQFGIFGRIRLGPARRQKTPV